MDDLEFYRQAYIDPNSDNEDFLAYQVKNYETQKFIDDLKHFDSDLKQAFNVTASEELAARLKLNQTFEQHALQHKQKKQWLWVASVMIFIGILFSYDYLFIQSPNKNLSNRVLSHIYHELDHLQERKQRSLFQVNSVLSSFGVTMDKIFVPINYLGSCNIGNTKGVHMVLEGKIGPITVLMLPNDYMKSEYTFHDDRFNGVILPSVHGSVAVIGEKGESLKTLKEKLSQHLNLI